VRTPLFGLVLRNQVADKDQMERLLTASDLDWTVVRVGRLTDGPARDAWRAADDGSIRMLGSIARADVAAFMVAQIEDNRWVWRKPVLVRSTLCTPLRSRSGSNVDRSSLANRARPL
jgi:uncharacterized protein YbjT (DUF2867 family)